MQKDIDDTNKIESLMSGCYEPTLSDVKRIYNEYSLNKGEIAGVLSDVFGWLAQDPIQYEYKNGKIYARAEVADEDILVIHFIYVNEMDKVFIEQKLGSDEDVTNKTLKSYIPDIKRIINDMSENIKTDFKDYYSKLNYENEFLLAKGSEFSICNI